jgi:formyltetrahydrofolate-dependent phosphoribosylglycinamide formyltransferase
MNRKRIAVLASGGGSNLQAILDHLTLLGDGSPADVVLVASDRGQSGALDKATRAGVEAVHLRDRATDSTEVLDLLRSRKIDLVALAGYLKMIPANVVDAFEGRMINVHPALLPRHGGAGMYGLRVHQAVVDAGDALSGATVHHVTHEYDRGPAIAQWPVGIAPGDDAHAVAARVLVAEHALYPRVIAALAAGDTQRFPLRPPPEYFAHAPITPDAVRRDIIAAFTNRTSS